ncbi:MAG TPA: hypothetical protein VEL75_17495, partial [Candidatus Methylomirabilis sp.]|nr:hypothetical protein [Candidatus Methylomirabilis sp.]
MLLRDVARPDGEGHSEPGEEITAPRGGGRQDEGGATRQETISGFESVITRSLLSIARRRNFGRL